jgi:hypothetical protein
VELGLLALLSFVQSSGSGIVIVLERVLCDGSDMGRVLTMSPVITPELEMTKREAIQLTENRSTCPLLI